MYGIPAGRMTGGGARKTGMMYSMGSVCILPFLLSCGPQFLCVSYCEVVVVVWKHVPFHGGCRLAAAAQPIIFSYGGEGRGCKQLPIPQTGNSAEWLKPFMTSRNPRLEQSSMLGVPEEDRQTSVTELVFLLQLEGMSWSL
jgi:hypothetical protein